MNIELALQQVANPEKSRQMEKYMRDQFPFMGITAPHRKQVLRDYLKTVDTSTIDWNFVNKCWQEDFREYQQFAVDYLIKLKKQLTADDIPAIKQLIITKSWWDTVDGLDELLGHLALDTPAVEQIMLDWSQEENFWLRRVAIDHQLLRKEKTNTDLLAQIICHNLNDTEFFINKAIGWSLRDYSKTNPTWVQHFIETYRSQMAPLSIREASKYLDK